MGMGVKNVKKLTPPFFCVRNHESFGVFFPILSQNAFLGPDSMRFVWGGVGQALLRFMQLLVVFALSSFLATLVTL